MVAGTQGNLPFKINVCAEGEFDQHQEMSDMTYCQVRQHARFAQECVYWKSSQPVGTGIGSSRSSICGIVAGGPES